MALNALSADVLRINELMIVIDIKPAGVIQSFA